MCRRWRTRWNNGTEFGKVLNCAYHVDAGEKGNSLMRKLILGAAIAALAAAPAIVIQSSAAADDAGALQETGEQQFVVVYTEGVSLDAAHAAVEAAGGTIVAENTDVGVATVVTTNGDFAAAADAQDALMGTAQNRVIGSVPEAVDASGEAQKFDAAEADLQLEGGSPSHGQGGGHHGQAAERRLAPCSGTCSRSVPPSTVRTGSRRQIERARGDHRHRRRRHAPRHRPNFKPS